MVLKCVEKHHVRWLMKKDLEDVVAIEYNNSGKSNPANGIWSRQDFSKVLSEKGNVGIVVCDGGEIVGFCIYGLIEKDKIHIFNLTVKKNSVRRGIGTKLIDKMKSKLNAKRRTILDLDVRETNLAAQLFLKKRGFKAVDVVRNWYEKPSVEDAYKFRFVL